MYKDDVDLVPCKEFYGFFKVPGENASVKINGVLYNYVTKKFYSSDDAPLSVKKNTAYAIANDISIHIAMAETILKYPEGKDRSKLIVNHKDGIKANNYRSNLEWVDYSRNIIHAYEIGLRDDNVRLTARNISTGETLDFLSIGECARFFKVNNNRVFGYINRAKREAAFLGTHLLVKEGQRFPSLDEAKHWTVADNRISVLAFEKETKKATIYQTATQAAATIGIKQQTLSKRLRRAKELNTYIVDANTHLIVPLTFAKDFLEYVVEDKRSKEWIRDVKPPVRTKPRVRITNRATEEVKEFENIYEMARHFGFRHETIMKKQKANNGIFQGHLIELLKAS